MAVNAHSTALATQARRAYAEGLLHGLPSVVQAVDQGARILLSQVAEPSVLVRRREAVEDMHKLAAAWLNGMTTMLRQSMATGIVSASRPSDLPRTGRAGSFSLVENDVIEGEILSSRLALSMMDRASWEFTDLRSRINLLEERDELDANDLLRPHVLARIVTSSWRGAELRQAVWRTLQAVIHDEFAHFAEESYHETNRWLIGQRVMPEIDLRPFIRRTRSAAQPAGGGGGGSGAGGHAVGGASASPTVAQRIAASGPGRMTTARPSGMQGTSDASRARAAADTQVMTGGGEPSSLRGQDHAEAVLGRLNKLIARQLPEFAPTLPVGHTRPASPTLKAAIADVQQNLAQQFTLPGGGDAAVPNTPQLLEALGERKRALKEAASSPNERAIIEIVALLFQSLLAEERIPAAVRVWFARLQMPVLRVAVGEPDFFATTDHPARRLIDRMGACVMGFDAHSTRVSGGAVEKEIKRVVQVVEAYPDTGRRVFQTVLTEFERFLEHYFRNENEASRKGVSLAQQVEQRETLAIQYTMSCGAC